MTPLLLRCLRMALLASIVTVLYVYHDHNHHSITINHNNNHRRRLSAVPGWSDPKTIVGKVQHHQRIQDSSIAASTGELDVSKLRIVAFGTSKTWGAGLDNPERETYISLLSPTAVNLGLRSTPADYPSLCLHSMIGDQVFDVIILEFSPFGGTPHRDFTRLVHKLRARFPKAIIIYLPIYMLLHDVGYQQQGLQDYLQRSVGIQSPKGPAFVPTIRNLVESDLTFPGESYSIRSYRGTLQAVDGYMVEFPSFSKDVKKFILDNAQYYTGKDRPWDFVHPNALGHQVMAHKLRRLLQHIHVHRPIVPARADDPTSIGTWLGGKDRCVSWFSGGNIPSNVIRYSNMDLVNFVPDGSDGKWALEVNRTKGGAIQVECPFPNCNIYVSYMAKGPEKDYPKVIMYLNHQHDRPIRVDPYIGKFHVRQIVHMGTVAMPGTAVVYIQPTPEDVNSPVRFRVTGVITTPTAD